MVFVKVSETYDLSTVPEKMGLIGIHTPDASLIQRNYPGLLMNCKKMRYVGCDVTMACASMLPADPLQIGVSGDAIAPQDMFNPILYKAMSNMSMDNLEMRIAGLSAQAGTTPVTVEGASLVESQANALPSNVDNWSVYYGLLSNRHGWKTAMPQQGLSMSNLVPLVHEKLYAFGQNESIQYSGDYVQTMSNRTNQYNSAESFATPNRFMYGNAKPMPSFNTTAIAIATNDMGKSYVYSAGTGFTKLPMESNSFPDTNPTDSLQSQIGQVSMPYIPSIYVAAIVMPPAKLNQLYYRIQVDWTIEFTEVRPISEVMDFYNLASYGSSVYFSDYVTAKSLSTTTAMVDTDNVDITKVM